jgi:UDP-4-amino-4,6-dideoxy-N-acetyl-beta-L-altrosamine N-acetyltransferase
MEPRDLEAVLTWRNHPDVRCYMLTQHEIALDEHREWFARASVDPARCLLIVEEGQTPLGFVHFAGVSPGGIADWGFYAVPDAPKGSGRRLGAAALDHAFRTLDLHKVCGQALDFNGGSIRLHLALGFQQEGVLRRQCRLGGEYHDLVCFGLLASEWP